jgi:hypothetical protein
MNPFDRRLSTFALVVINYYDYVARVVRQLALEKCAHASLVQRVKMNTFNFNKRAVRLWTCHLLLHPIVAKADRRSRAQAAFSRAAL